LEVNTIIFHRTVSPVQLGFDWNWIGGQGAYTLDIHKQEDIGLEKAL
jgi:hypothetical protein